MKPRSRLFPLVLVAALSVTLSASACAALASQKPSEAPRAPLSSGPGPVPGNYCVSCHAAQDPRLSTATAWKGEIGYEVNSPCPAASRIHQELYYTERMLLMIDRAEASVGPLSEKMQRRLDDYSQQYSRQLDQPVTSLDAFVSQAQTTRYSLNKAYASLNELADAQRRRTVTIYAGAATLVILGSLAWGLYNTRAVQPAAWRRSRPLLGGAAFILVVLGFFAAPIFRVPAAEVAPVTTAQQEAQSVLDAADRAASAAGWAQGRAWMLARVGADWIESDPAQARTVLEEAVTAADQARKDQDALWGQSLSVQETMIGVSIDMENADLIADDLNAARARAWSIPLISVEMRKLDSARAAALLEAEQAELSRQSGSYRDLQLRGVARAWADVDATRAVPAAQAIRDPSIRAWTLRELAVTLKQTSTFDLSTEAARQVADPVQRARALRELAVASGNTALFGEALAALEEVDGAALAYALSDLAEASGDATLADRIEAGYPDARAAAYLRLGQYQQAWDASLRISDPYERGRAQAAIAGAWGDPQAAAKIEIALYRDLARRDIVRASGNAALADSIQSVYYRVQALTALGEYEAAAQLADDLADAYPLIDLASALCKTDPQAALELVQKMRREADKAPVLAEVAAATNDPAQFEQAQGMALAARVQGDPLAPSRASMALADLVWQKDVVNAQAALRQAYEAAQRISIK